MVNHPKGNMFIVSHIALLALGAAVNSRFACVERG
jgi:hypothetical protein